MSLKAEITFAINFLELLDNDQSSVFSPASILNSLAMLYAGTDEITAQQLLNVIGEENLSQNEILHHYSTFFKYCQTKNSENPMDYKLLFSNKLFLSQEPLLSTFSKCMTDMFDSQFEQVDFRNKKETAEKINNFVETKTEKLLKNIVSENDIGNDVSLFLVNALCFIGQWEERFENIGTHKFYGLNSSIRDYEMLQLDRLDLEWNLTKGEGWRCLGIPYKTRNSWMHILLPNSKDGLPELLMRLDYSLLEKCIESKRNFYMNVTIPAFKIESEINLEEKMKGLGLTHLFQENPESHGIRQMFQGRHFIDKAIHKAGIKVGLL